ncbi:hypothetical protein [Kitasatospora brasiliensis]|uniref:hypothetical protein n=1 Tax=Kitasatospora brasiliensis TaxID=3058040 RepID=UPI00292CC9BF|nr:hypothetical protein [Kitasatospora sp. K002]
MNRSLPARVAVVTAVALLLATAAGPAAASGRRDVTADQCRDAGGHVEGTGYCADAAGADVWGAEIDGQAVNPDPRPGEED